MIIEVTGTSTRNKGAELMLVAIKEHFRKFPDVSLAVDQFFGSYADRANYGLLQKITLNGIGRSRLAVTFMPSEFRRAFGLVREADVDVLLDAAGFAFGDQHPSRRTTQFAVHVEEAKSAGKKIIMLPQALGPFTRPDVRDGFERIVDAADLIFVRDDISMQYVRDVVGTQDHIWQAPDFTNLVAPELSLTSGASDRAAIVPNQRMVEKARSDAEAATYVPLIGKCIAAVNEVGCRPVLVLHGHDDVDLAIEISRYVGGAIDVHREDDPVALKRFLGESYCVIASRYHALVSALSQGVPSIGTSWSHKYEMLFNDYGCDEMLLPLTANREDVQTAVERATGSIRSKLATQIRRSGDKQKKRSESMWRRVDEALGCPNVANTSPVSDHYAKASEPSRSG